MAYEVAENIDINQLLDGNGSEAQKSELLKVLALVGLSLEDLNNDPEVRELVSEVFEKFRNEGCTDDTAALTMRMTNFEKKTKKNKGDNQPFDRMAGRREGVKRLTKIQIEEKQLKELEFEENYKKTKERER